MTLVSFSSLSEALKFFDKLNNLPPSLAFTMEEEKNNKLPFWIYWLKEVFLTSIYSKPTFTGLYRCISDFLGLVLLASHLLIKLPPRGLIVLMLSKFDRFLQLKWHLTLSTRMYFLSSIKAY